MIPLALALSLFAQSADAAPPPADPPASEDPLPAGAPSDDYQFVGWCYGSLRGYLDLHDAMMPEVTRIEGEFQRPGTTLAEDLKVYADMQKDGRAKLKLFIAAMTAAEKASVKPINVVGAQAVRKGRDTWNAGPDATKAHMAQAWMGWALPARCERVAKALEVRSKLMGATLKANSEEMAPPADPPAATDAPPPAAEATSAPAANAPAQTPSDPTTDPTAAPAPEAPAAAEAPPTGQQK